MVTLKWSRSFKRIIVVIVIGTVAAGTSYFHGAAVLASIENVPENATFDRIQLHFFFCTQIALSLIAPRVWNSSRLSALGCYALAVLAAMFTTLPVFAALYWADRLAAPIQVATVLLPILQNGAISLLAASFLWPVESPTAVERRDSLVELFLQLRDDPKAAPAHIQFDGKTLIATQKALAVAIGTSPTTVNRQIKTLRQAGVILANTSGGITTIQLIDIKAQLRDADPEKFER